MARAENAYELAQSRGRAELRGALLDAASRLLAAEGVAALTMRRVAAEVGCSTTVLYTMFGGKDGLAEALYREGFERFRRRLAELASDPDPLAHLYQLAAAYRASALADPHYYRVMFLQAIPGFVPDDEALAAADAGFDVLIDCARACVDTGVFVPSDPGEIAQVLWAAAHGVVSLELAGHLDSETAPHRYETVTRAAITWFLRPEHEAT